MNKYLQHLLFGSVLLVSPFVALAQDCPAHSVSPECLLERAQDGQDRADKDLNSAYQRILKRISVPKDEYRDYPRMKVKFIEAQRQWVRFRDAECDAWYMINEAGADRNLDLLTCLTDRTKDRTKQLEAWQANLP